MNKTSRTELAFGGLSGYAMERRVVDPGDRLANRREGWIRDILRGMAERWGEADPDNLIRRFDARIEWAKGKTVIAPTSLKEQHAAVEALRRYSSAVADDIRLEDPRDRLSKVYDLLTDIRDWRGWIGLGSDVYEARTQVGEDLTRATARQPIRFTRVLIGPELGPCRSDFVAGAVTDGHGVEGTALYKRMTEEYPEVECWPVLCVVYGGGGGNPQRDASEEDLQLMREAGDRFLKLPGVRPLSGCHQMKLEPPPTLSVFRVRERGAEERFRTAKGIELLECAELLRKYESYQTAAHRFAELFPDREPITPEQFEAWESARLENTGQVAGAFEIDLDAGQFTALNIMDGWVTFGVQDVKAAARLAFQDDDMDRSQRWRVLLDDLYGKEIEQEPPNAGMTMT